jgi:hypothetical protein
MENAEPKKDGLFPEPYEEGATGKLDNKGAIFIPGGLIYKDRCPYVTIAIVWLHQSPFGKKFARSCNMIMPHCFFQTILPLVLTLIADFSNLTRLLGICSVFFRTNQSNSYP